LLTDTNTEFILLYFPPKGKKKDEAREIFVKGKAARDVPRHAAAGAAKPGDFSPGFLLLISLADPSS
jgi:hypothetical protein